jgi:hypothetical protein
MRPRNFTLTALLCLALVPAVRAERPPQQKNVASDVVVGTVEKVTTSEKAFGGDGVLTNYTATLTVDKVERGDSIKPGDTITVTWFHVTKRPSRPLVGAFGHQYPVKEKGSIRAWLLKGRDKTFGVIYNSAGIEKADK